MLLGTRAGTATAAGNDEVFVKVVDPEWVSEHNPEGIPKSWGVSIAWMSSLYSPGEGDFEPVLEADGSIQVAADPDDEVLPPGGSPSYQADRDIWDHPEWRGWLTAHMIRRDVFNMLRVDDVPKRKFTARYAKKRGEWTFVYRVPVQDFLTSDERTIVRVASCELFHHVAKKLDLPAPPAVLHDAWR